MAKSEHRGAESNAHRIRFIEVVGGFLDGLRIDFTEKLNCIIGGRGTGKTTIVELLRYAFDAFPEDPVAKKRVRGIIEKNLDFGRVDVGIRTRDGMNYVVCRSASEDPVVLSENREATEIQIRTGDLFAADIFSQNDVESIADQPLSQLHLIDNFESRTIADFGHRLRKVVIDLSANSSAIGPLQERAASLREEMQALPGIEERLKGFAGGEGTESVAIDDAHAKKALRDREKRAVDRTQGVLEKHADEIDRMLGKLEHDVGLSFTDDILAGPNGGILKPMRESLIQMASDVDDLLRQTSGRVRTRLGELATETAQLAKAHTEQELAFRELIEKHQEAMGQATERAQLEKQRNELLAKKHDLEDVEHEINRLSEQRNRMVKEMTDLRQSRFQMRDDVANRINTALSPEIKVNITQDGNLINYKALVDERLKGSRVSSGVSDKLVGAMWPSDLAAMVRAGDMAGLVERADLNDNQAEKVLSHLGSPEALQALETVELIDEPKIELNDNGHYKDSRALSTGQKCTAILPILLMESEKPLIIDQPEDNLDNRFVSEAVVKNLRSVKGHRQLIFVTHNPNIPVLGDAEGVYVLDSDGKAGRLVKNGDVDECKAEIITLLEGGEDAFVQRKERYGK